MYNLLVFVHVFSAVVWIGGVIGLFLLVQNTRKHDGPSEADRVLQRVERLLIFYLAGPLLVLATGVTMVATNDAWSFSQPWVYLALVVFVVGVAVFGSSGPAQKKMEALRESGEAESDALSMLQARYIRSVSWGTAILASVEILMVFRPGL